ncbi:MAG: YfhO family protein [Salibacteraceae bacterium]
MLNNWKSALPHFIAILGIIAVAFIYCSPVLEGKQIEQSDIVKNKAQAREAREFAEKYGRPLLWTTRVFSGMTTFNISAEYKTNVVSFISKLPKIFPSGPRQIILLGIGFYILLISFGMNPWLAMVASMGYCLSSNLIVSIVAGHNTKVVTIAYMAPALAGIALAYRGKVFIGSLLTMVFTGLMLNANHLQIVYYFLLVSLVAGVTFLIKAIRDKSVPDFAKTTGMLIVAALIGALPNFSKTYNIYVHSKETIRGGQKFLSGKNQKDKGGLDRSYAMSWSYAPLETFTIVVPTFYGGASQEYLPENGEVAKLVNRGGRKLDKIPAPTYIGDQPFTQGTVYFGAAFIFLFILALFIVKDQLKIWLVAITLLSFMISWGRHFEVFTGLLFDYLPFYNKFRTPSMALAIAGLSMPLLGLLGLHKILTGKVDGVEFKKAFTYTIYVAAGLMTLLLLYGLMNDWTGPKDAELRGREPWNNPALFEALVADRKSMYLSDWFISTVVMAITATAIWFQQRKTIKLNVFIAVLGLVLLSDMWRVSRRYMNKETFVTPKKYASVFEPNPADKLILQDDDPHFRVINATRNPWTDGLTSYWHENVGGHHAAKIQRYQDLIERQLSPQLQLLNKGMAQQNGQIVLVPDVARQMTAYNMLNTKYFIVRNNAQGVVRNPYVCGNAWFVERLVKAPSHDEEMAKISQIDPNSEAIIHEEFADDLYNYSFGKSAGARIQLTDMLPDHLTYETNNEVDGLAVFSEVYYTQGWEAYIDGEPTPIYRANYVLRALKIPAGQHKVEMIFKPSSYPIGESVSLAGSILFVLFAGGMVYLYNRKQKEENTTE